MGLQPLRKMTALSPSFHSHSQLGGKVPRCMRDRSTKWVLLFGDQLRGAKQSLAVTRSGDGQSR